MDDLTLAPGTDATALYRWRDELYASDLLIAAIKELDFFTWLDANPATLDQIARHYGFQTRPVDVMTTLFAAMGLLVREGPRLRLVELAREHLVSTSPWFIGAYYPRVTDRPTAMDLLEVLRTGQPARFASRADEQDWLGAMAREAFAAEFLAAMDCRGRITARALAPRIEIDGRRLLDVAGGTGIFACALAAQWPRLTASVLEKPPVDRIAARAIAQRGLSARVEAMAGDMLQGPLPVGYDVHLFSNVLHDWDEDVVQRLLQASARALPPGGQIVVHDAFLNPDKTGPLAIASYSVLLMHVTQGRCYSVAEIERWLSAAGFSPARHVPTALGRSALVAVSLD